MRKPKTIAQMFMFDIKFENKMSARKAKVTRLKNMLATGKPVFCTYGTVRVRIVYATNDIVKFDNWTSYVSIDKLTLFKHTR